MSIGACRPELADAAPATDGRAVLCTVRAGPVLDRRGRGVASPGWVLLTVAVAVGALALVLRLWQIDRSYDIFIDEISYTQVAVAIATGHGVTLYGRPFALQPPAVLGLLAAVVDIARLPTSRAGIVTTILDLRTVSACFGALATAGAVGLVGRAASWRAALLAGLLMAVNPFVIHYDSEVMLEAATQAAAVGCFGLLAAATWATGLRSQRLLAVGAGILGGMVVTSKETFGLVVVLSLVVLASTGWAARRPLAWTAVAGSVAGYGVYLAILVAGGGIGTWWRAKVSGLERIIGTYQPTGFNSPETHVTLLSRVAADGAHYAVTYVLMAVGSVAAVVLLWRLAPWRRDPDRHVADRVAASIAVWAVVAAAYVGYETFFGSIEEQMFYIAALPSTAALVVAVARRRPRREAPRGRRWVAVALAMTALAYNTGVWAAVHTRHDAAYSAFVAWERTHLPPGSVVSAGDGIAQFLLTGVRIGVWTTPSQLAAHHVQYVLISTSLTDQGYAPATPGFVAYLTARYPVVWSYRDPTVGDLRLYRTTRGAPHG